VRGLIVDELNHVLLALLQFPTRSVWVLPGGGIEADEEHHDALHRELREEVGLYEPPIGELLWTRTHVVPFIDGLWDGQRDHAYLVRTTRFDPQPELSVEQLRSEHLVELRWWSIEELSLALDDISLHRYTFRNLLQMLCAMGHHLNPSTFFKRLNRANESHGSLRLLPHAVPTGVQQ